MADRVEIVGADRLAFTARRAARGLDTLESPSAGRKVALRGRLEAPRVSGRLASSVTAGADGGETVVFSRLVYAPVIHNGWARHHIRANPFLARAAHASTGEIASDYADAAQDVLGQIKGA